MAYDFPNTPALGQVYQGWVWDGVAWQVQGATAQGAVRFDTPQGLNANQQAQARANIGVKDGGVPDPYVPPEQVAPEPTPEQEILFDHENRVRALEGQPPLEFAEFAENRLK